MASTIAEFIRGDVLHKIENGELAERKLTLASLAESYNVSLTPVRQAVEHLIQDQALLRRANGRLAINPAKPCESTSDPDPGPAIAARSSDWETALVEEIVMLSLRGDASYLREEAVAHRYGVGRTVVRQSFSLLAGKGILEHVPRCGWRVQVFDEEDMSAYLIAREAMELTALDLARPRLDPADLQRMLQHNEGEPCGEALLDNHLHAYLIETSGNPYIRDFFDRHGLYYTTLFDVAAPETHVMREMADQHREILRALLREDWAGAREALSRHIRAQRPIVRRLMKRIGSPLRAAAVREE